MSRRPSLLVTLTAGALVLAAAAVAGPPALAATGPGAAQTSVPSLVPASGTPQIQDGATEALAQVSVGGRPQLVVGGTFSRVRNDGTSTDLARRYLFSFDIGTGKVSTTFAPSLNGTVNALLPGPTAGTVYVAGSFSTLGGASVPSVILLDVATGARIATFAPPSITKPVNTLAVTRGQLLIGGSFTKVGTATRNALASLDPSSGALTSYLVATVAGHHNYGHVSDAEKAVVKPPAGSGRTEFPVAKGATQVGHLAVDPQGTTMVAVGNFFTVNGSTRDQIALFDLGSSSASLDTGWATSAYSDSCFWFTFDGYMRDVDFSPDGSYFTVAAAGGHDFLRPLQANCDSILRFETAGRGADVAPTWRQLSGSDSFLSVANTGAMVIGAGHPRWANNPLGFDGAAPGAVARPSIMGIDPVSGQPLAWNPGREPRAHGIEAILVTSTGVWMGSDTAGWGNNKYQHGRLAFFPLAGGSTPAPTTTSDGTFYVANGTGVVARRNTSPLGDDTPSTSPLSFSSVHGAVVIGGTLFYGGSDNQLHSRRFDGGTVGTADTTINPYSDPLWDNVIDKGRVDTPLKGMAPDYYSASGIGRTTALAYDSRTGRLYYTLTGDPALYYRAFSPDSGVLHPVAGTVSAPDMTGTTGMTIAGGTLTFVKNGTLREASFDAQAGVTGGTTVVDSSRSWTGTFFSAG